MQSAIESSNEIRLIYYDRLRQYVLVNNKAHAISELYWDKPSHMKTEENY